MRAIQCAALIVVPDSVTDPVGYYRANVAKSLEFVAHLLRNGCERMIFSSSAAIYRPGADLTVDEDSPLGPRIGVAVQRRPQVGTQLPVAPGHSGPPQVQLCAAQAQCAPVPGLSHVGTYVPVRPGNA